MPAPATTRSTRVTTWRTQSTAGRETTRSSWTRRRTASSIVRTWSTRRARRAPAGDLLHVHGCEQPFLIVRLAAVAIGQRAEEHILARLGERQGGDLRLAAVEDARCREALPIDELRRRPVGCEGLGDLRLGWVTGHSRRGDQMDRVLALAREGQAILAGLERAGDLPL